MSDLNLTGADIALIITACTGLITTLTSSAAVIIGGINARRISRQAVRIEEVHASTNGMKDELVASTARESHAQGYIEGRSSLRSDIKKGDISVTVDEKKP